MKKRGVVLAGVCEAEKNGQSESDVRSIPVDASLIRASLLYWDKIDIPDSSVISVQIPSQFNILKTEGILSRTIISQGFPPCVFLGDGASMKVSKSLIINGREFDITKEMNNAPLKAFQELAKQKDTLWSYVRNSQTVATLDNDGIQGRRLLFEIHEALPLPAEDVSLEEILEFKNKRGAELQNLRVELDAIYHEISNATDMDHAKVVSLSRLEKSIAELTQVSKETLRSKMAKSFKFDVNPVSMAGAVATLAIGQPLPLAASIAFFSCLSFSTDAFTRSASERGTPYQYLIDVKNTFK